MVEDVLLLESSGVIMVRCAETLCAWLFGRESRYCDTTYRHRMQSFTTVNRERRGVSRAKMEIRVTFGYILSETAAAADENPRTHLSRASTAAVELRETRVARGQNAGV